MSNKKCIKVPTVKKMFFLPILPDGEEYTLEAIQKLSEEGKIFEVDLTNNKNKNDTPVLTYRFK